MFESVVWHWWLAARPVVRWPVGEWSSGLPPSPPFCLRNTTARVGVI